jgi:ABC-type transporter Mla subunit MlaD
MRRAIVIGGLVAAVIVVIVLISSGGGESSGYVVRAIFDNGSFMVKGEQVRVAGANVGSIESVGVTMPGEVDSYEGGVERAIDGKAVLVMKITDPGFQDFRSDATCIIRPQSLIGEKFVDCRPTLPRAPGAKEAPSLKKVPSGQPGAGQYLLPLENNSTSVDPDLINDINKLPYAQRFRLIFNELGAGLAGRGADIEAAVKRANPALRDVDRLLGILNSQRDQLTQLASDSEQILGPLSRERAQVAGFFTNSGAAAQATTERGKDLEASLQKFPAFLRQFRTTMHSLQGFSDVATPVFADLGGPVVHRNDPPADPVLGRLDRRPEVARRHRRRSRPDAARGPAGRAQDEPAGSDRRQPDQHPGGIPRQHQGNQGLRPHQ